MNNKSSFLEILNKEGYLLYPFKGISMLPLLDEDDDLVRIEIDKEYHLYDVILFKKNGKYVLHRIIATKDDLYRVRGDNALEIDVVKYEDILGKMVGYYKKDKYISIEDEEYLSYLNNNFIHPKRRKKTTINAEHLELTSYKVNDNIKNAYKALFRFIFNQDFDIGDIIKLSKEEFNNFYLLCLYKKSDHILKNIIDKYHLEDIDINIINNLSKTEAVVKSRYLFHDYYKKEISSLLSNNHIKHLFIKGAELISKYPHPLFRSSNDIDIYVAKTDLDKVSKLIKDNYVVDHIKDESIHRSFSIYKGKALIEIHYALLEEKEYLSTLFIDPFKYSKVDTSNPYLYHLNNEYYYLYHLGHFIKHIKMGEFWLNMLMDSYLIKDYASINLIKENKLERFYLSIKNLLDNWMNINNNTSPLEDIIFQDAFTNYVFVNKNKYKNKFSYVLARLFPHKDDLIESYPKLAKYPLLYPYYLFVRLFKALFTSRRAKPIKELKTYNSFSKKEVEYIYQELGLIDYYK